MLLGSAIILLGLCGVLLRTVSRLERRPPVVHRRCFDRSCSLCASWAKSQGLDGER